MVTIGASADRTLTETNADDVRVESDTVRVMESTEPTGVLCKGVRVTRAPSPLLLMLSPQMDDKNGMD